MASRYVDGVGASPTHGRQRDTHLGAHPPREGLEHLLAALEEGSPAVRWLAGETLAHIGAQAVPALTRALVSPRVEVRREAARALGDMGSTARRAAVDLLDSLEDPDRTVRLHALLALRRVSPNLLRSARRLINLLEREQSVRIRRRLIHLLASIGPDAREAIGSLVRQLDHPALRVDAALALREIDPRSSRPLDELVSALDDPSEAIRRDAARAIRPTLSATLHVPGDPAA